MKTNLDKLFKTNEKFVKDGVEFAIDDKTYFTIRHFNEENPRIKAAIATHHKPYARQIDMGTLSLEKTAEIQVKIFVDACLVNWAGVEDENGTEIPFTRENALVLFRRLPALFNALWAHANDYQNYREDVGNS